MVGGPTEREEDTDGRHGVLIGGLGVQWTVAYYAVLIGGIAAWWKGLWILTESEGVLEKFD